MKAPAKSAQKAGKPFKRLSGIQVSVVDAVPAQLEHGVLYIARKAGGAAHLCACGCGERIDILLTQGWSMSDDGSILPAIQQSFSDCRSHYFVTEGRIVWMAPC